MKSSRLEELKQFLKESPQDTFLKYAITMEYRKMGDAEKTLLGFEDLMTNHPDYLGAYYHFAKFLEEQGRQEEALNIYKSGMALAESQRNRHAYNELQAAYNLASGIDEDDWDD